jgi:putative acetyltransferase
MFHNIMKGRPMTYVKRILVPMLALFFLPHLHCTQLDIRQISREQIPAAKETIIRGWNEVTERDRTVAECEKHGLFDDLNDVENKFVTFLVLTDGDTVVGTAGIKPLSNDICELKRMWLLQPYRNKGWGAKLLSSLLTDATVHGFKRIRLEVYVPHRQQHALHFYRKHGFYEIPAYCESREDAIYMEKMLQ